MFFFVSVLAAFSLCVKQSSQSAFAGSPAIELTGILNQVWENSAQLKGQESLADAAANDRWRRFIFNEPQLQYTNSDDNTAHSYGLILTAAFPGKTLALTRLDAARARSQKIEYQAKKYDLTKAVTQAYLDCAAAQAIYDLQTVTAADLETVFHSLRSLYETGHSTQAEKIGAELQSRQARVDLRAVQDKQAVLCQKLDSLLPKAGGKTLTSGMTKLYLPDDLDESVIQSLGALTSDQSRALAAADTAVANSSTAWWSQLPDLAFNVTRNHYVYLPGSPSGKEWTTTYGASLTFPFLFPFHEGAEAGRAKSQALIDQNTAELQKVVADSDQADGAREYRRSRARLDELRAKDLALGEALVESTYSAYRAGKLGYAELVLSRKTLTDLRTQDIQLRASIVNAHLRCLNQCQTAEALATLSEENTP